MLDPRDGKGKVRLTDAKHNLLWWVAEPARPGRGDPEDPMGPIRAGPRIAGGKIPSKATHSLCFRRENRHFRIANIPIHTHTTQYTSTCTYSSSSSSRIGIFYYALCEKYYMYTSVCRRHGGLVGAGNHYQSKNHQIPLKSRRFPLRAGRFHAAQGREQAQRQISLAGWGISWEISLAGWVIHC
jgi:hypothetical protein